MCVISGITATEPEQRGVFVSQTGKVNMHSLGGAVVVQEDNITVRGEEQLRLVLR